MTWHQNKPEWQDRNQHNFSMVPGAWGIPPHGGTTPKRESSQLMLSSLHTHSLQFHDMPTQSPLLLCMVTWADKAVAQLL